MQITAEISKIKKLKKRGLYFPLMRFRVRYMKRCYLQKNIAWLFGILKRPQWQLYGIHEHDRLILRIPSHRHFLKVFINRFFSWVISALFRACHYFSGTIFFIKNRYSVLHYIFENTNADLKISLYVLVHIKTIPWKFSILNPRISRVLYRQSLQNLCFQT